MSGIRNNVMGTETTRVERLCALFAPKRELVSWRRHKNELRHSGGITALAEALGVDNAVISRWNSHGKRGNAGAIPPAYNQRIIEAADRYGIDRKLLYGILDDQRCPTCGQTLAPGQYISVR